MWSRYQSQRNQNSLSREGWYTCNSSLAGPLHIAGKAEKHPPAAEKRQKFLKVVENKTPSVFSVAMIGQITCSQQRERAISE